MRKLFTLLFLILLVTPAFSLNHLASRSLRYSAKQAAKPAKYMGRAAYKLGKFLF
jgi:hypothetical protein